MQSLASRTIWLTASVAAVSVIMLAGSTPGNAAPADTIDKLKSIAEYPPLFQAAFPGQEMSLENVAKSIATYERTVVSGRAPFDAWIESDDKAISAEARRGFVLFNTKANCVACHSG